MKKKKPAAKKATTTKPAAKSAAAKKPATKQPAAKPAAKKGASRSASTGARPATYTPPPVQGTGWAPFRYPPQ